MAIKIEKRLSILFIYLAIFPSCFCLEEPTCSKYHFEEKVLEKVVRFEHNMEIITETVNDISGKVKNDIATMKKELETQRLEQTNSFNKLSEKLEQQVKDLTQNISTEWNTIKNDFDMMKNDAMEQRKQLNNSLQCSFERLSAQLQQPSYAFSAYDLSAASGPSIGTILVFARTHINENSVYSTTTGKFTAPVDGIYVFHAILTVLNTKKHIDVEFNAGGKAMGRFRVGDDYFYPSSSGSAVVQLQKGAEVYLKVLSAATGLTFREDSYAMSTFSGHILGS